jgi:hypothetical protein
MSGTTPAIATATAGSEFCLLDRDRKSSSEPETATLFSSGESSSTPADSKASTARYSGTKVRSGLLILFDRQMQSLITSGLVRGITHTSIRKQSGAAIRASALWPLDGGAAGEPKVDC